MLVFNEESLVHQLSHLTPKQRAAFALTCSGRLVPTYKLFGKQHGVDPDQLENIINYLWGELSAEKKNSGRLEIWLSEVMRLMPAEDERWTSLHAYAEDAVAAVAYCIRTLLTDAPQEAAWAARRVYEALDRYVIENTGANINEIGVEAKIVSDPQIQAELERQKRDIGILQNLNDDEVIAIVQVFRSKSEKEAITLQ